MGVYLVQWWRDRGALSDQHARNTIYLIAFFSLIVLVYSWYKAFQAVSAIMGKDSDNLPDTPETVICLNCREPFAWKDTEGPSCPNCGGTLEDLRGFYERHPEFKQ
jgi:hypothetical protein